MTAARDPLRPLRRWLFDPVPIHSLIICRIGLGSVLFFAYLSRWPLVDRLYGPDGIGGHAYFQRFPESGPVGWRLAQSFDQLQQVSSGATIWALYFALLLSSLCFALGVWPRVSGTIALILHSLFLGRNAAATWGWATMIKSFLIYVILASTGRHWSVVAWIRARKGSATTPVDWTCSAWPLRLLQVHVTCVFLTLWTRVDEASWVSGQTLFEALISRDWGRFDVYWHPYLPYVKVASQAAMVLELGAVVALWIRPIARYWALALIGMFIVLVVTTSIGWWDFMMIFALTVFLPDDWLERVAGPR
jgi:hypothetical protein